MAVHVDRSLSLPQSEYFPDPQAKSGIALHHTVCHSAHTTLDIWSGSAGDREREPTQVSRSLGVKSSRVVGPFPPSWRAGVIWCHVLHSRPRESQDGQG